MKECDFSDVDVNAIIKVSMQLSRATVFIYEKSADGKKRMKMKMKIRAQMGMTEAL
jgi:hypothetical protein